MKNVAPGRPALRAIVLSALLGAALAGRAQTAKPGAAPNPAAMADSATAKVPFEGLDLTWVDGQNRQTDFPLVLKDADGKTVLTGLIVLDGYFNYNFARPLDHTQTVSGVMGRANEFSLGLAVIGIESNYKNTIGRLLLQTGSVLHVGPETDRSVLRGRNTGTGNLKYIQEAAVGYHFNVAYGLNVELGIFTGYFGLESFIPQENWSYQRSLVVDFTAGYHQGVRVQLFPTKKLVAELWLVNGWQSYNLRNRQPALGHTLYYRPSENVQVGGCFYYGNDSRPDSLSVAAASLANGRSGSGRAAYPSVMRFHHDNSVAVRYYHQDKSGPLNGITQAAFTLNTMYGFQSGTDAAGNHLRARDSYIFGSTLAHRLWFAKNKLALTTRVSFITNPSRYLSYNPSVVGFTDTDASKLTAKEFTTTFDIMPVDFVTFRFEYLHRRADVPYFAGRGGTTSPNGYTDQPLPENYVPDLRKTEDRLLFSANFRL